MSACTAVASVEATVSARVRGAPASASAAGASSGCIASAGRVRPRPSVAASAAGAAGSAASTPAGSTPRDRCGAKRRFERCDSPLHCLHPLGDARIEQQERIRIGVGERRRRRRTGSGARLAPRIEHQPRDKTDETAGKCSVEAPPDHHSDHYTQQRRHDRHRLFPLRRADQRTSPRNALTRANSASAVASPARTAGAATSAIREKIPRKRRTAPPATATTSSPTTRATPSARRAPASSRESAGCRGGTD